MTGKLLIPFTLKVFESLSIDQLAKVEQTFLLNLSSHTTKTEYLL